MSRLYYTENGNVVSTLSEELTVFRRARKVLRLPRAPKGGTLYFLARCSAAASVPLRISVNAVAQPVIATDSRRMYQWFTVPLDVSHLKEGENVVEFWTDGTAMNDWSLAIEGGHADPQSFVSQDQGRTWCNERMSYLNILTGEYAVRIRLNEGEDPPPPAMQWEDRGHPRVKSYRSLLPIQSVQGMTRMQAVRRLTAWLSRSWRHINSAEAAVYTPWDPETILAWGKNRAGHDGRLPVVMCVHYAVAFVSACQTLGIPARCAVLCGELNGTDGHFAAEVWFDDLQKWVFVDPNADAIFARNGTPLSIPEIREAGSNLKQLVQWGEGTEWQRSNPNMVRFIDDLYLTGVLFRHRAVWARSDFLSHPEFSPPGHGSMTYSETLLVWEAQDQQEGFAMFPNFGGEPFFARAPE